jgi:HEAT repeat protein
MMKAGQRLKGLPVPRLATFFVLAAALGACCVAWLELREPPGSLPPGPETDPFERLRSIEVLVETESEAVSQLVSLLGDDDPKVRRDALFGLARLGTEAGGASEAVRLRLADGDPYVREYALSAFSRVCPDRDEAYAAAGRGLLDPVSAVRDRAGRVLRETGRNPIPAVGPMVASPSAEVRGHAAQMILILDPKCDYPEADKPLRILLKDADYTVRRQAVDAAVKRAAVEVDEVRDWLLSDDSGIVEAGLFAVDYLGLEREELLPELEMRIEQPPAVWSAGLLGGRQLAGKTVQEHYWQSMLAALALLKGAARPATAGLLRQIETTQAINRLQAAGVLLELGADRDAIVSLLLPMVAAGGEKHAAASLLARADPEAARRVAAPLIERYADDPQSIPLSDLDLLSGLAAALPDSVPLFTRLLEHRNEAERLLALHALRESGPAAASAVPDLVGFLARHASGSEAGRNAIWALGKIGPGAKGGVPVLLRILEESGQADRGDRKPYSWDDPRDDALWALARIGDASPRVLAALRRQLNRSQSNGADIETDDAVRLTALQALIALGAETQTAIPDILDALGDRAWFIRAEAVAALVRISADPERALDLLRKALDDENPFVRTAAAAALRELGPQALPAAGRLRSLADDGRNKTPNLVSALIRDGPIAGRQVFIPYGRGRELASFSVARAARWALAAIEPGGQ